MEGVWVEDVGHEEAVANVRVQEYYVTLALIKEYLS